MPSPSASSARRVVNGKPGRSRNRSSGVRTICTGLIVPHRWQGGGGPAGLGSMSGERCDVAVVGSGLVGLSLAYELACLGASVTVIDAGHPGRATDAGAGILSPLTSTETEAALWPFLRQAGDHYPALLVRLGADGADVA